jgi:hypothetical protein
MHFSLSFSDLRTRYLIRRPILVSRSDAESCRVFSSAFGGGCTGYLCLDAVLGRCVLAVCDLSDQTLGLRYLVYDSVSPMYELESFFHAQRTSDGEWAEVLAMDEGGGIISILLANCDGCCVRIATSECQLLYRTVSNAVDG